MKEKEYKEIARNEWEGISGPLLTKEEVWARLGEIPEVYAEFAQLSEELQRTS